MAKDIKKAQTGINIPPMANVPSPTSSNQSFMQERFGGYREPGNPRPMPNISTRPNLGVVKPNNGNQPSGLDLLLRDASTRGDRGKGDRITTADEYEGADRYDYFQPSSMGVNNEDMAGQYQSLGSKAVNGVTKGLILAGTTFIQGTAGLVNGVYQAIDDGKFSSFYDNEFNRGLDEINKWSEDALPNYYTTAETEANFYSPKYWATGNFVFDGVIKNLGFAAGAYLTGGAYTNALKALPGTSRLFSMGKAAETLAATEKGLSAANKGAGVYGEIKALSDSFLAQYNLLNPAGRAVVAGLSTTGEAGIEALHNSNEFRQELIDEFKKEYGVVPGTEQMDNINAAVEGAGNASFYANVGILTASNYVMFPRIARSSFKADKRAINGLVREIDDIAYEGGKYAAKTSKLHPLLRTLNNVRPYTFTVSEGLEEVSQYGSSVGTQDYYNKQYNNEATSWLTSIGVGLTKGVFSDEGAKNALIGGLSGGIMTGRGRYRRNQQRAADTAEAIELLNDFQLSDFTKESIYSNNRAGVLGEELEQAAERGDMLSYKNLESQYIINYLTPRIKYGRLDLVMQDIADMKKLSSTEQGFAQLVAEGKVQEGETKETFIARLENFKQTANDVSSLYQSLELRYGGITEEGVDGKRYRTYGPAVINKMIYAASTVADTDSRIPQLSAELQAAIPTLNIQEILQDLISGEVESFNNAVNQIQNLDILSDKKDVLGEKLNDVAALAKIRELMLQEYELIKTNPKNFQEKPLSQQDDVKTYEEILEDDANTFVVKAKNGEQSLQIGQEYFVGQGVNFEGETPLGEPVVISSFVPVGQNEDGTIQIKDQSGQVRDISPDVLLDYNVGRKSTLLNNKTANFYYRHRDKVFEFNFGKNKGGKRKGRLMYDNGKLFFVYKDSNGTIVKKYVPNKLFTAQRGFDQAIIEPVGKVTAEQQDAANQFLSPEELAKNEQTLQSNREDRLKVMNDLGVESKRRLEEINKQLEKDRKKLAIIKKDLESIYTMKEGGSRIKLTYSKAQKNFTRAINNYTAMQQDTQDRIIELEREQEELDLNISYFEAFEVDLLDLPGNTKEFLKELKDQLSLLEQNGKAVNNEIKANNKLLDSIKKATKKAAKLLKSALETTYVYDEDYGDYLKDLLEKSVTGEDLLNTWPLLKQELANFNLTNDIQKETNVSERGVFDALESRKELEATLESLRKEYVAKKVIVDRFQRVMDEYAVEKQNQDKIANNTKLLADLQQTANTGPVTDAEPKSFDPISKKSNDVVPRASVGEPAGPMQDHHVRANTFGVNLNKFANRKNIRAIYLTLKTQDQKLDGVVQRILDNGSPELMEKFGDSIIVMVMIDTAGNLVGVDGQPIPNTKNQLDNAIYQTIPESSLTNTKGSLFRVEDSETAAIKKQFGVFRKGILDRNMVGVPFKIEASFGIPQYEQDSNENNVLGTTSVVEADLISETDLSKTNVIFIPTTNKNIFKGTVTYSQPFGSVFLDLPNGYVKLRNRKHTTQEAEAIYDSLHALSKEIVDLDKGATSDTSVRLFNFLKGVTYWGIPVDTNGNRKTTGQNSVFFEREIGESISGINFTKLSLKMGVSPSVDFNPVSISKNKEFIIETLGQMYNNIDNSNLKNIDQSFEQITKINENGTIESITWPNYQTYLLSKNIPGGGTRQDFQLPLHTTLKPVVEGSDEVNRGGVYFVNEDSAEDFISEVVPPKSTRIQVISPKGPPTPAQQTSEVKSENISSKGSEFAKKLTNPGNNLKVTYKGREFRNAEHAYQTYKSGEFDQKAYDSNAFKPVGSKPANRNTNYQTMVDILKAKLEQHPELIEGISQRGGLAYIEQSTHNVTGDKFWESKGQNKFIEALGDAYRSTQPTQQTSGVEFNSKEFGMVSPGNTNGTSFMGFKLYQGKGKDNRNLTDEELNTLDKLVNLYIGQVAKGNMTIPQVVETLTRKGYTLELPQWQQLRDYITSVTNPNVPKIGNNKDSFTDWRQSKVNTQPTQQTSEVEVVLDNKQTNTFTSPKGKKILFKASPSTTVQNYKEEGQISVMMNDDLKQLFAENPDAATQEKIKKNIKKEIYNYIAPELAKLKEQDAEDEMQMTPEMFDQIMAARKQKGKSSPSSDVLNALKNGRNNQNNEVLREVVTESIEGMSEENWKDARAWMSKNLPGVSFNRVKNIIKTKDGKKAWGFFENNSIYVYENAEVGTVYHEAFEAVFAQFLSPQEKEKLFNEFTSRKGTFVDRPTGRTVKYSQATRDEMREQLAEDFRDYIQDKKKPEGGFFSRVFKQLKDLIEKWFLSPQSQTYSNELFDKIDGGGFVSLDYLPLLPFGLFNSYDTVDFATPGTSAVFRVETGLSDVQVHDTIEHMTYLTLRNIIANNESLFSVPELNQTELYSRLKGEVLASVGQVAQQYKDIRPQFEESTGGQLQEIDNKIDETVDLMQRIDDSWTYLTKKHKEYILSFGITFDEANQLQLEEDRSNKGYNSDATKIDNFKKTGAAVKLLLATVPIVTVNENADVRFSPSTINGVKLLPVTQTFITVLENVSNATSIENMLEKLRDVALNDPNYLSLYKRLSGRSANEGAVSLDNITERHQLTLLAALFKTFKKQNPIVKIVNVLENGETVVSEANLSTASRQMSQQYLNSIVTTSKRGSGIFKQVGGVFNPDTKKLSKYPLNTLQNMFNFLGELGIPFNAKEYNNFDVGQKKRFASAVNGIKKSIEQSKDIKFFSTKSLNFAGQILNLATLKVIATNPEVSSTYFNIDGERVQTYIGTNAASEVHNFMTSVGNKQELGDTPYSYLLTDVFAQNSTIIERIYDAEGNLRTDKVNLFKPGYAGGILNGQKGTAKGSSQLQFPDRLRQELNLNINGQYLNLVPGDSSLEHTLEMGNPITERDIVSGGAVLNTVMKGYFLSEVELAREKRDIVEIDNRQTSDLRFFKEILGEELHEEIRQNVLDPALTAEQVYELSVDKIIDATSSYIQRNKNQYATFLLKYGVIQQAENEQSGELTDRYTASGVEGMTNMTIQEMDRKLLVQEVNYIISNIEMHKILYGDPYGYKDELKRTKSFLSPRQAIVNNSPQWNNRANEIWNRGLEIDTVGHTEFTRDYFRTVTGGDVTGVIDIPNYKAYTETDGGGIISIKAYRNFRIRTADWNDAQENQYRYDIAWYKRHKSLPLSKSEKDLLKEGNPQVQSTYVTLKPIVSGAKLDKDGSVSANNNVVLDKYALYPLSYRVMHEINPTANALKLYDKMQKEDIDYLVFESGRKVGAEGIHDTYNDDGEFNNAEYESVINIPFNIMSLQSEVPSKEDGRVTRASQITKLTPLDYLENGMPIDYKGTLDQWLTLTEEQKQIKSIIYAEIQNNTKLLDEMTKEGLNVMMKKLGITRVGNAYKVTDLAPAAKTLREELFKRETNDNISDALDGFLMGDAVLEATQSYNQIRNILYSIVQKSIVRPKINGGQKVQIPSALFESTRAEETTINGKTGYTSEVLKFYNNSKGENVMEVMVGRWFGSSLSDEALLEYLNNTEEGQKILRGVAFRIPTQKQNSIDAIKIKQFLPKEFGDNVVVPAALVEKVGSDFDIDKLFMYLKNVTYINNELQLIPFYGYGEQSKKRFGELFDAGSLLNKTQQKELQAQIDLFESGELEGDLIEAIFGETFDNQDVIDDYILELKDKGIRQTVIDRMYMRSLENEFIQSTENLITFPENYERLTVPNDASQLEELSKEIVDKTKESAFNYRNVGNLLNRRFMARLRNAFVQGKRGIGIAAVNQTNLALNQHSPVFVELNSIKFRRKNTVNIPGNGEKISLSGVKNKAGDYISDINGQVIDGMVDISAGPWVIELGITPTTASTWLYLIKAGVPIDSVAYFMNQPIIVDYLNKIEESGYTWLFIEDFANELKENKYDSPSNLTSAEKELLPDSNALRSQLGKTTFSNKDAAYQRLILDEFLNYAKQAQDLFEVTQGTNWDTSTFNDPLLIFKKEEQYLNALQKPIFSYVDGKVIPAAEALVQTTFLKETILSLTQARNGIANFLTSDQDRSRTILQKVLRPYINRSDRDFIKISRAATNSFFDYAVQTDQNLNMFLKSLLIDKDGIAFQVDKFVEDVLGNPNHPLYENQVVRLLESDPNKRVGDVANNIKLRNNDRKVYEQNSIIYAFRQLKEELGDGSNLYSNILISSILQSGLNNSPISFTSLLPYEDFQKIYNQTLSTLEKNPNLNDFYELGMFERNNWSAGSGIVPSKKAPWVQTDQGKRYNPAMLYLPKNIKASTATKAIPQLVTIGTGTREGQSDYITYSWNSGSYDAKQRKEMASKGDFSFINKALFKKIKSGDEGFIHPYKQKKTGKLMQYFVYKHINALGDSYRAQEYYINAKPSVFDNGLLKAEEKQDVTIIEAWKGKAAVRPVAQKNDTSDSNQLVTKTGAVYKLSLSNATYSEADINTVLLTELGYTEEQAGEIFEEICKI